MGKRRRPLELEAVVYFLKRLREFRGDLREFGGTLREFELLLREFPPLLRESKLLTYELLYFCFCKWCLKKVYLSHKACPHTFSLENRNRKEYFALHQGVKRGHVCR